MESTKRRIESTSEEYSPKGNAPPPLPEGAWAQWGKDAVCFMLPISGDEEGFSVFAINSADASVYHVADFRYGPEVASNASCAILRSRVFVVSDTGTMWFCDIVGGVRVEEGDDDYDGKWTVIRIDSSSSEDYFGVQYLPDRSVLQGVVPCSSCLLERCTLLATVVVILLSCLTLFRMLVGIATVRSLSHNLRPNLLISSCSLLIVLTGRKRRSQTWTSLTLLSSYLPNSSLAPTNTSLVFGSLPQNLRPVAQ